MPDPDFEIVVPDEDDDEGTPQGGIETDDE